MEFLINNGLMDIFVGGMMATSIVLLIWGIVEVKREEQKNNKTKIKLLEDKA